MSAERKQEGPRTMFRLWAAMNAPGIITTFSNAWTWHILKALLAEANNFPPGCRYESRFATDFQTLLTVLKLTMGFLTAGCAKDNQILGHVIAQSASRLNMVNLTILDSSTRLATPAVSI